MHHITEFLRTLDRYLGGSPWFPTLLLGTGLFFTLYLRFPQIRYFRHALRIVTGRYERADMPGDTTHFQALSTALSGTIGTGNIGGVGLAIFVGGPPALLWMWVTAFLGMTTKFVECTLSHKYRVVSDDGTIAGGPMYYMERKLGSKALAVLFAIGTLICAFGTGNMPQVNNIAVSLYATWKVPPLATASVLSVLLALVILGGIRRIARTAEILVPFMSGVYVLGALAVIAANWHHLDDALAAIVGGAFSGTAATGGFLGASFSYAFSKGVGRGLYSNEAGQGSAAIAHAAAKADEPVSEGMVAILEPFIDTLLICTLTGLAVVTSGAWHDKFPTAFQSADLRVVTGRFDERDPSDSARLARWLADPTSGAVTPFSGTLRIREGRLAEPADVTVLHARSIAEDVVWRRDGAPLTGTVAVQDGAVTDSDITVTGRSLVHSAALTTAAFQRGPLGERGGWIVAVGLLLFAFSTVISWSYYGDRAVTYLVGSRWVLPYRIAYVIAFFCAALVDTSAVWALASVAIVAMTVPNLVGILLLHKDMKETVAAYWRDARWRR